MVGWLIALDKCPGVRHIGVGEALQHILCKVVALATWADLEDVCGVVRLSPGLRASMEEAIHAVCELFDLHSDDSWGFCLLMQEMLLIQLIMWLHYGMLEFFGCTVLASSSILTGDKPNCLFRGLIFFA